MVILATLAERLHPKVSTAALSGTWVASNMAHKAATMRAAQFATYNLEGMLSLASLISSRGPTHPCTTCL